MRARLRAVVLCAAFLGSVGWSGLAGAQSFVAGTTAGPRSFGPLGTTADALSGHAAIGTAAPPSDNGEADSCTKLVDFFETYGVPPEAPPLNLDSARSYQKANDQQFCKQALANFEAAGRYPPVQWPSDVPASVKGLVLHDSKGDDIGKVDAIVTSGAKRTAYLIVTHGGLFGFGVTRTPIQVTNVAYRSGLLRLREMTVQEFNRLPAWDPEHTSYREFTPLPPPKRTAAKPK